MIELPTVTLVTVDGVDPDAAHATLVRCSEHIAFGDIAMLSSALYSPRSDVRFHRIPPMDYNRYNLFIIRDLYRYIRTDFALLVQPDGYILNPHLWSDDFLAYDYVGAPWPAFWIDAGTVTCRIGNGGFNLRSKRVMQATARLFPTIEQHHVEEDRHICSTMGPALIERGMRFAPVDVAARFSLENPIEERDMQLDFTQSFGFHGKHNLDAVHALYPPL